MSPGGWRCGQELSCAVPSVLVQEDRAVNSPSSEVKGMFGVAVISTEHGIFTQAVPSRKRASLCLALSLSQGSARGSGFLGGLPTASAVPREGARALVALAVWPCPGRACPTPRGSDPAAERCPCPGKGFPQLWWGRVDRGSGRRPARGSRPGALGPPALSRLREIC